RVRRAGRVPAEADRPPARHRGADRRRTAVVGRGRPSAVGQHGPAVAGGRDQDRPARRPRRGGVRLPEAGMVTVDLALIFQTLILGVLLGGQYALLASGLTLYFGVMRVVMLAHAAFLVLGAYLAWWFQTTTGLDPMISLVVTVLMFFAVGVLMQRYLFSRLRPATLTMMSCLLTLAVALVIEGLLGFGFTGVQRRVQLGYG